ncbi:glycosyltransferase family 2 protein [Winogradskyella sp.]|jgi:glycosyltransferase involved in cell wall biosynthesis|uniref:glycosyltransferase family 2 protein n=1 Tax=Winogradskyella sp. TaxID=1883156 RepID=UPI0025DEAE8C|nr:glycosyltransferase family A protein [Winogradskyella sp.]MCT4628400.1 glycosyltransferase family 2 protein [Winogradskyella sp.]
MFNFLKYIQPTHYFALPSKASYVFPVYDTLSDEVKKQLQPDDNYASEIAKHYDLSWQAIQLGYVGKAHTYRAFENTSVNDNYYFLRKYFNSFWAIYVLFVRLLSFENPIKEISGFIKSRNTKRSNYLKKPITYDNWKTFNSSLIRENPKVSVIIPTLNRYEYLHDVLKDLEQQDYTNFEVIIIDQSEPFNASFYESFTLDITVEYQEEKALWLARNKAVKLSKGEFILLFDDDSRVEPNWISNHIRCVDFFNADISSGVSLSVLGDKIPENYSFFRRSDQLDTGNVLIRKQVFKDIGLFDRQFEKQRMGDGEFGLRAHKHGFINVSNPYAKRVHLKVGSGGLREMGSWDAFRPKNILAPRPIPSVLYLYRHYFGNYRAKLELLRTVPSSVMPYRFKGNKVLKVVGLFVSVLIFPLILFQVLKSWRLASIKLNQGAKIEYL